MSLPTNVSQANDKPEKQILLESISPAENLDAQSSQLEAIFGIQIKTILDPKQLAKVAQLYIDGLQLNNDSLSAQARKTISEALKNEEEARKLRLANDETEKALPRTQFAIWSTLGIGGLFVLAGLFMIGRDIYQTLTGSATGLNFIWIGLTVVGILLLFGGRYLPELLSSVKKTP